MAKTRVITALKVESADEKVQRLIAEVKRRRAELSALKKPQWLTCCSLQLPGFERINIQVEQDLTILAVAIGVLSRMRGSIESVFASINLVAPANWNGYLIEDWISDLQLRLKITQIQNQQKHLAKLELALDGLLSPEQRRELELARIEQELKE